MKHFIILFLFLFLFLFLNCTEEHNHINPVQEDVFVEFDIFTKNVNILDEIFKIKNENFMIDYGVLPIKVLAIVNDTVTVHFEAHVSNWGSNHPECDCVQINSTLYKCTQSKIVDGSDFEVATE